MPRRTPIAILTLALLTSLANAQPFTQAHQLLSNNGVGPFGDQFGESIALSETRTAVGASKETITAPREGAVYVFDTASGALVAKLVADDRGPGDELGVSLDIHGDLVIAGSTQYDDEKFGTSSGAAYVFDLTNEQQLFRLQPPSGSPLDFFGESVAISERFAVVGAPSYRFSSGERNAVFVFDTNTGDLVRVFDRVAFDGNRSFGESLDLCGSIAIVGDPEEYPPDGDTTEDGAAYIFDLETGDALHRLVPDDALPYDRFGHDVAIDGDLAVVGAFGNRQRPTERRNAYVFDVTTGQQLHKLAPDDPAPNPSDSTFGARVAIDGTTVVVANLGDDTNGEDAGAIYVFNALTGQQIKKLTASDAESGAWFGRSLAADGGAIGVGAPFADTLNAGAAYVFRAVCTGDCDSDGEVTFSDLVAILMLFGQSVGISCDADSSGMVDFGDLVTALNLFGQCVE